MHSLFSKCTILMLNQLIICNGNVFYLIKTVRLSGMALIHFKLLMDDYLRNNVIYIDALFKAYSYLFSFVIIKNSLPIKLRYANRFKRFFLC